MAEPPPEPGRAPPESPRDARPRLLAVAMTEEDREDLARLPDYESYEFVPLGGYDEATYPEKCDARRFVAESVRFVRAQERRADGIIGFDDYPPSLLVPAVGRALGLAVPSLDAVFRCEHKLWSRVEQRRVVPDSVPRFAAFDSRDSASLPDGFAFPFWLKPVKSFLSYLSFRIGSGAELERALNATRGALPGFIDPFNALLADVRGPDGHEHVDGNYLLAEELMSGRQCTLEGYVRQGEVRTLGIVDSVRFPNRVSFKRFDYPSALPARVQGSMHDVARRVMERIGFGHGLFNIEFFWDPRRGAPTIIEINSRFCPQFSDLFEKVDGVSTHKILVDLALGRAPDHVPGGGTYRMAASFVQRTFRDRLVRRVPGPADRARVREAVPDAVVKVRATEGQRLSDWPQDSYSYRYGLINLGGTSASELEAKFERANRLLPFELVEP